MKKSLNKFIIAISILGTLSLNLVAMESKKPFQTIKKINENLYVGKVTDEFYLAMEQINKDNLKKWFDYASNQLTRIDNPTNESCKILPSSGGVQYFYMILDNYAKGDFSSEIELWVAYASRRQISEKTSNDELSKHVRMFVTTITSPKALIMSNMGISRSLKS